MIYRPVLPGGLVQVPPLRPLLPGGYFQSPLRPVLPGGIVSVFSESDPLAGLNFAVRLQTHNGNNVPLGLYQDTSCTVPATQDFDPIAAWRDELFGTGVTLTQSNTDKQPILLFDGAVPTVDFDGIDDLLGGTISGFNVNTFSAFVLGKIAGGATGTFYDLSNVSELTNTCSQMFLDGGNMIFRIAGGSADASFAFADNNWHVLTGLQENTARSIYDGGTLQNTNNNDLSMSAVPVRMRAGRLFQDIYPLTGGICAILLSPETLTADRTTVETYLATLSP